MAWSPLASAPAHAVFPGSPGRIAFVSDRHDPGGTTDLYTMYLAPFRA